MIGEDSTNSKGQAVTVLRAGSSCLFSINNKVNRGHSYNNGWHDVADKRQAPLNAELRNIGFRLLHRQRSGN